MTDKFGDWKFYPEDKPEKEGLYFVLYGDKDSTILSSKEAYYDGKGFPTEDDLEVVAWMPESEARRKENEVEDQKDQIIKALRVIRETCLKNSCEICPFGDDAGDCRILEDVPEKWTLSGGEQVWRALK